MNKKQNESKPPDVTKCKSVKCNFKSTENGYCGKHQTEFKKLTLEGTTCKKVCNNHIRGCWNLIDKNIKFARCDKCREIERAKDLLKRAKTKTVNVNNDVNKRYCSTCVKPYPLSAFVGDKGQQVMTCTTCREANKRADKKRSGRSRNWTQEMQNNPERKEKKDEWKADNHDKMTQYYTEHRAKKINEKGVENVNAHNAEVAKQWRDKNKDKVVIINEEKRLNPNYRFGFYKLRAENMGMEWSFTIDEFKQMISEKCNYCGYKQEGEWNGIDRKDNNKGYLKENCVTCCRMCNMMKGDIEYERFYKMVMHIVSNLMLCKLEHSVNNLNQFKNSYSSLLKFYKIRAEKKNIPFLLTDEQFNIIRTMNCYLCNKPTNSDHINGIDRIDSKKGYDFENCVPCCAGCNYLKKDYAVDEFIYKLYMIYCKYRHMDPKDKQYVLLLADINGKLYEVCKHLERISKAKNTCKYTEDDLTVFLNRYYNMCLRARTNGNKEKEIICRNIINAINNRKFNELDDLLELGEKFIGQQIKKEPKEKQKHAEDIKKYNNEKQQRYRDNKKLAMGLSIEKKSITEEDKRVRNRENQQRFRDRKKLERDSISKPIPPSEEKIREQNRLRKQRQRDREKVGIIKTKPQSEAFRKRKQRFLEKLKKDGIELTQKELEDKLSQLQDTPNGSMLNEQKQCLKKQLMKHNIKLDDEELEDKLKELEQQPKKITKDEKQQRMSQRTIDHQEAKIKKYSDKNWILLHSYEVALARAIKLNNNVLIEKYERLIREHKNMHPI
jgi:hypothetical protein